MDVMRITLKDFLSLWIVLFFCSRVSTFTFERTSSGQRHILVKRSHLPEFHNVPHHKPHFDESPQQPSAFEDDHHWPNIRHDGHGSHHPSIKRDKERDETIKMALGEEGLTRVVYDEDETFNDDDYYYDALLPLTNGNDEDTHHKKNIEKLKEEEKKKTEIFPKKISHVEKEKKELEKKHELHTKTTIIKAENDMTHHTDHSQEEKEDSSVSRSEKLSKKSSNPLVLPVTTEGKQKTEDPLIVYGFPKELLPIMPGGGSRFEDVEREKLEKKKMSQMKGDDDDSAENGGGHEAEGLYSSASLSSISLCIYWLASFHHLDRLFML